MHRLNGVVRTVHVGGEVPVPHLVGHILEQGLARHTGVVHQQRHRAPLLLDGTHHVLHLLPPGHIRLIRHGLMSFRRQLRSQTLSAVLPYPVVDADLPALTAQLTGHRPADAPAGAGDKRDLFHFRFLLAML